MTKRMGGMGRLSDFGKTSQPQAEAEAEPPDQSPTVKTVSEPKIAAVSTPQPNPKLKQRGNLVTLNIKIAQSQQEWLADMARNIRGNNSEPVLPGERVYPQHLIGVAIDLLESSGIDWDQIKNVHDLREVLKIKS